MQIDISTKARARADLFVMLYGNARTCDTIEEIVIRAEIVAFWLFADEQSIDLLMLEWRAREGSK
jgi:hypothetical protein